jgi:hypothetical protein
MNRKTFLKNLLGISAAVIIAPAILEPKEKTESHFYYASVDPCNGSMIFYDGRLDKYLYPRKTGGIYPYILNQKPL